MPSSKLGLIWGWDALLSWAYEKGIAELSAAIAATLVNVLVMLIYLLIAYSNRIFVI